MTIKCSNLISSTLLRRVCHEQNCYRLRQWIEPFSVCSMHGIVYHKQRVKFVRLNLHWRLERAHLVVQLARNFIYVCIRRCIGPAGLPPRYAQTPLVPRRSVGGEKGTPGNYCLRMRVISGKIGYRKGGSFQTEGGFRTLPIISPPQTQEGHVLL